MHAGTYSLYKYGVTFLYIASQECICNDKAPVTPSRVSTACAWSCLNFQSAVRSQANLHILAEIGLSQRPYSDHGIATEIAWRSVTLLRSSPGDSLRSYDTRTAHDGVLKTQYRDFPPLGSFC